uniref:Uncharacterized protein n=1 Tax=Odontella aurita TaxID=265563 RepID=A0A7S4JDT6_9STRA|mmetsp:Transcript_44524/g.135717  ORF Transcript_44524/g.135717 Transcript_44524/m.135717 type:complete len:410 (+) Transcript_44524:191-1420(+)
MQMQSSHVEILCVYKVGSSEFVRVPSTTQRNTRHHLTTIIQKHKKMSSNKNNMSASKRKTFNQHERFSASACRQYLEAQRAIKQEMAAVSLLWLVGCPLLSMMPHSGSDWGKPQRSLCELYAYSVSASMTGLYPKIAGSILAPLFAVFVVQRSSGGLCGLLKLGWIARYSPLLPRDESKKTKNQDDAQKMKALKLWNRIEIIEYFGYLAACFLVGLVAFDSQSFLVMHDILATIAFLSLCYQNHLVGKLGADFPDLFPNWYSRHAEKAFQLGMLHFKLMFSVFFIVGPIDRICRCANLWASTESLSLKLFGTREAIKWLLSVALWYNEYAFCFLVIYVQLLEHYELRLWDFAGEMNMPYAAILSRFSFRRLFVAFLEGFRKCIFNERPVVNNCAQANSGKPKLPKHSPQ